MRFSTIFTAAACLTAVSALPTPQNAAPPATAQVTFIGAAGAQYSIQVPLNNQPVATNNALSISQVSSTGVNVKDQCTLDTVDFPPALVQIAPGLWNVGPPQTVKSIKCSGGPPPPKSINVEFDGAAGAKYSLTVPLDGSVVPTNNALSISNIVTTYPNLPACKIIYVDFPATLVLTAPNTWSVGPPQTVKSIQCFP